MLRHPKKIKGSLQELLVRAFEQSADAIPEYLKFNKTVDAKGRYLPYHKFRFKVPKELDPELAWFIVRAVRDSQSRKLLQISKTDPIKYCQTPTIEKVISFVDRHATNNALEVMCQKLNEKHHFEFLFKDLVEDEAISSSQLEGAATTTLIAKEILRRKRKARSIDDKMILGNFKLMNLAWENRNQKLSIDLIRDFHEAGVEGIDDEKYTPGVFRKSNDVVIQGRDGEILHYPPDYKELASRLIVICDWINNDEANELSDYYLHPLIKAITLHFLIGHEHPFNDGNGRVARALFYWYLFKNEYGAFRYIAVSTLLKKAPSKYADSYVYTENDSMDMTYFIEHQCGVILKALLRFQESYEDALVKEEQFERVMFQSGVIGQLTKNQKTIFLVAMRGDVKDFTAKDVELNLGVSNNTAAQILKSLCEFELFSQEKVGRTWVYNLRDKIDLIRDWN